MEQVPEGTTTSTLDQLYIMFNRKKDKVISFCELVNFYFSSKAENVFSLLGLIGFKSQQIFHLIVSQ